MRAGWVLTRREVKLCLVQCSGNNLVDPQGDCLCPIQSVPWELKVAILFGRRREYSFQWSRLSNILSLSSLKEALLLWSHMFKAIPEFVVSSQKFPLDLYGTGHDKKNYSPWPLPQMAASSTRVLHHIPPSASARHRISHGLSLLVSEKATLPLIPTQVAEKPVLSLMAFRAPMSTPSSEAPISFPG